MHYKNGREANNGDQVVILPDPKYDGKPFVGILYNAKAGNDYCNGKVAPMSQSDPTPNLRECLHLEDFQKAVALGENRSRLVDVLDAICCKSYDSAESMLREVLGLPAPAAAPAPEAEPAPKVVDETTETQPVD